MKFIKTDDKTVEIKKVALNSIRVQDANISLTIGTKNLVIMQHLEKML